MTAYVDTSILLRVALGQADALPEWRQIDRGVTSALARVEGLRTLDRLRLRTRLADAEVGRRRAIILQLLDSLALVEVDSLVLDRAAQPLPTELGTLDAIHLATALLWRETMKGQLIMATHDVVLATAAQAHGFRIVGVESGR
jgi:predicted nucleic acid-binding protein